MKKFIILFLFALLAGAQAVSAKIWRVNNNPGVARDFDNIQAAVTAAKAAVTKPDTIHVEGSVTPYDVNNGVVVDTKVCILGPGFYLSNNPETQHLKPSARVHNITFIANSAGSVLAGVEQVQHTQVTVTANTNTSNPASVASIMVPTAQFPSGWTGPRLTINESNIKVLNCKLNWVEIKNDKNLENIDIRKCWFCPGLVRTTGASQVLNLNIINNFFRNDAVAAQSNFLVIDLDASVKANIGNNTFYGGFQVNARNNCNITNNVFYAIANRVAGALTTAVSNTYFGNISNITGLGGMVNGQNSNTIRATETAEATSNQWFTASGGIAVYDQYFQVNNSAGSPILQAASSAGVTELGMYGGLSPYVLSGMTNIPSVYEIVMPAEVSSDGFDVTVKVKAH
jgi:hypothetical protein